MPYITSHCSVRTVWMGLPLVMNLKRHTAQISSELRSLDCLVCSLVADLWCAETPEMKTQNLTLWSFYRTLESCTAWSAESPNPRRRRIKVQNTVLPPLHPPPPPQTPPFSSNQETLASKNAETGPSRCWRFSEPAESIPFPSPRSTNYDVRSCPAANLIHLVSWTSLIRNHSSVSLSSWAPMSFPSVSSFMISWKCFITIWLSWVI